MPRSIEAFSLILLESLRSLEEPGLAERRYAIIKGRSTPRLIDLLRLPLSTRDARLPIYLNSTLILITSLFPLSSEGILSVDRN